MDKTLKYAIENGIIDLSYVQEQIEMNKRKELLEKHTHKIWKGKDGKWYTYFADDEKRRVQRRRNTKKDFRKPEKTSQVYTDEERKIMVEYLKTHMDTCNLGLLIIFATGLRIGELAALKTNDISDNKIHITKTEICYESHKGKYIYEVRDFPKTEAGIRYVRVQDDFIFFLKKAVQMAEDQEWLFYIIISQMGHTDIDTTKNYYYYDHFDETEKDKIFSSLQII